MTNQNINIWKVELKLPNFDKQIIWTGTKKECKGIVELFNKMYQETVAFIVRYKNGISVLEKKEV